MNREELCDAARRRQAANTQLIQAIYKCDLTGISQALDSGADPNCVHRVERPLMGTHYRSALSLAVQFADEEGVRLLLGAGADQIVETVRAHEDAKQAESTPNLARMMCYTPIVVAIRSMKHNMARLLLAANSTKLMDTAFGGLLVIEAVNAGCTQMIDLAIDTVGSPEEARVGIDPSAITLLVPDLDAAGYFDAVDKVAAAKSAREVAFKRISDVVAARRLVVVRKRIVAELIREVCPL